MSQRVLIVDDEATVLRITRLSLEKAGYRVSTASDGAEALEMLRRDTYDVLVTDVNMPRMSGEELCLAMQTEELASRPITFVATGRTDRENRLWAEPLEDVELMEKPVSLRRLIARIRERLDAREVEEKAE